MAQVSVKKMITQLTKDIDSLIGEVRMYPGTTIPTGWHLCDGTALSRTTYKKLYAAIGTTYGVGDGSTTFNLPDLRDKFPRGIDGINSVLNSTGGYENKININHNHVGYSAATNATYMSATVNHDHYLCGTAQAKKGSNYDRMRSINHTSEAVGYYTEIVSTAHTHTFPSHATQASGINGYHLNFPPYTGLNFIIYIGA